MFKRLNIDGRRHGLAVIIVWVGTLLEALFGFGSQVILARYLGAESYGLFVAALGFIALAAPLAGFGVSNYWLKCFGAEGWGALRWLKPSFHFIAYSTAIVLMLVHVWGRYGPNDPVSSSLFYILSWTILGTLAVEFVCVKLQLEERFAYFSLLKLLPVLLRFLAVIIIFFFSSKVASLVFLAWTYLIVSALTIFLVWPELRKIWALRIDLKGHSNEAKKNVLPQLKINALDVMNESWVFGAAGVLYLAWNQGHIVLAKYAIGNSAAGLYGSAMLLINAACLLPSVMYSKFMMPKIHRWANHDLARLQGVYVAGNRIMFLVGVVAMIITILFSQWGVSIIFGESFSGSGAVLAILALTLPVRFLGYSVGSLLVAKHFMRTKLNVMFAVVILNMVSAFLVMPFWGLEGLAFTIVVSEIVLIFSYYYLVRKNYQF